MLIQVELGFLILMHLLQITKEVPHFFVCFGNTRVEIRVCFLFGSTFRERFCVRRVSFCLAVQLSLLHFARTNTCQMTRYWGPGLPGDLSLSLSLLAGLIVPFHPSQRIVVHVALVSFTLWDLLCLWQKSYFFLWTVFHSQASFSGSQLGSNLGHLSLAKTSGSLLIPHL